MIFKSKTVNLDPEPWVTPYGRTSSEPVNGGDYQPRPEFEPTRDPAPWTTDALGNSRAAEGGWGKRWSPRREQFDTPVNRIMVEFREGWSHDPTYGAANWLISLDDPTWDVRSVFDATPAEIDHARRVLTRLANWKDN